MKKIILMLAIILAATTAFAIPAKPGLKKQITLENGNTIEVFLKGDEFAHWWEDANGVAYAENNINGTWRVEDKTKKLEVGAQNRLAANKLRANRSPKYSKNKSQVFEGSKKSLLILVNFQDKSFKEADAKQKYEKRINGVNYTTTKYVGSVRDYFYDQSYGKFDLQFDVVGPVTLSENYKYYGENDYWDNDGRPREMIAEACELINDSVNFADYDWDNDGEMEHFYVLYAGYGEADGGDENTIWPHQWSLQNLSIVLDGVKIDSYACGSELNGSGNVAGIGTICHEYSHCLGIMDAYDTDYSKGGQMYGMGTWDIMSSGSYNGSGFVPPYYSAYERMECGWVNPIELKENMVVDSLKPLSTNADAYIVHNPGKKTEFFLFENRKKEKWDKYIPAEGMLVHHIDFIQDVWDMNEANVTDPERWTILPADNHLSTYSEEGDCYPYEGNDSITDNSRPAFNLLNKNTDGTRKLHVAVTNITKTGDIISFNFAPVKVETDFLFHETFDDCAGTGGNDGLWSGTVASSEFLPDYEGWVSKNKYGGLKCARFGKSGVAGETTTPEFTINGKVPFTFEVAPWGTESGDLEIIVNLVSGGNGDTPKITPSTFTMQNNKWNKFEAVIEGSGNITVTFKPAKRLFINDVKANKEIINAITDVKITNSKTDGKIYSIDGRYVGTDINKLNHGIYIINGKKIVK